MQSSSRMPLHGASTDVRLRSKLVCFVGIPVASTFIALIVLDSAALRKAASAQANERATLLADRTAQVLNSELSTAAGAADTLATVLSKGSVDFSALPVIGGELVYRLPLVAGVVFGFDHKLKGIPRAGYTFLQNGELTHADIALTHDIEAASPWYKPGLKPGPGFWTAPFYGEVFGGDIVSYSTRFKTAAGIEGFVVVDVPLGALFSQLKVAGFDNVHPSIVTQNGEVIKTPWVADGDKISTRKPDAATHVIRTAEMPAINWTFKVAISRDEVFAEVQRQLFINASLLAAGGVIVLCVLLLTGLRFSRRIEQLSSGVASVSAGELDVAVSVSGHDEVGQLAADFNTMTAKLQGTVQQVAEEVSRRTAVERDLSVAREIQQSMLPRDISAIS